MNRILCKYLHSFTMTKCQRQTQNLKTLFKFILKYSARQTLFSIKWLPFIWILDEIFRIVWTLFHCQPSREPHHDCQPIQSIYITYIEAYFTKSIFPLVYPFCKFWVSFIRILWGEDLARVSFHVPLSTRALGYGYRYR